MHLTSATPQVSGPSYPLTTLETTQGQMVVALVNSHANATFWRWHLWEIDLRFASGLPPGWVTMETNLTPKGPGQVLGAYGSRLSLLAT